MKISVVRTIANNKELPSRYRLTNTSRDRMPEPVKLQFNPPPEFKFLRHRRTKHDDEAALRKGLLWVFRNTIVRVEEASGASRAEIVSLFDREMTGLYEARCFPLPRYCKKYQCLAPVGGTNIWRQRRTMDSTAPAEDETAAQGIVKGDRDIPGSRRFATFAEDVPALSPSDAPEE